MTVVGSITADEEDAFSQQSTDLPLRGERYTAIVDISEAATPTPRFMRLQAAAQKRRDTELAAQCAGIAFVVRSPMIRGALKAILYLQPLPCPQTVVRTRDEAESWVSEALPQPQSSN